MSKRHGFDQDSFFLGIAVALAMCKMADDPTMTKGILREVDPNKFLAWARRHGEIKFSGLAWLRKHYPSDYEQLFGGL